MEEVSVDFIRAGFAAELHVHNLKKVHGVSGRLAAVAASRPESAQDFAKRHQFQSSYATYRELLADETIDVVCISAPNAANAQIAIDAARAGKHIICAKPLTGPFGESSLSGAERAHEELTARSALRRRSPPPCARAVSSSCTRKTGSMRHRWRRRSACSSCRGGFILDMRAGERHSGSHTVRSRQRGSAGGGSLMLLGSYPIAAVMHLKQYESELRGLPPVVVTAVTAEVMRLYETDGVSAALHSWVVSDWDDVEAWGTTMLTFSDDTKAVVTASFAMPGGVRNAFEVYTTNAAFHGRMTPNDAMKVYTPDPNAFGSEYLHEKLESRTGWISASPDDDWERGYLQEMQGFMERVATGRQPLLGLKLARAVIRVVYASYLSAEIGQRVPLASADRA